MFANPHSNSNQIQPNAFNTPFNSSFNSYPTNPIGNTKQVSFYMDPYQGGYNFHHSSASNHGLRSLNDQSNQIKGQFLYHNQRQTNFQVHRSKSQLGVSNYESNTNGINNIAAPGFNQCLNGQQEYNFSMNPHFNNGGQQQVFNLSNQNCIDLLKNNQLIGKQDSYNIEFKPDATWLKKNDDYIFMPEINSEFNEYVWACLQSEDNPVSQQQNQQQINEMTMQEQYCESWSKQLNNGNGSQHYFSYPASPSISNYSNGIRGPQYLDNLTQMNMWNKRLNHKIESRQQNNGCLQRKDNGRVDEFNRVNNKENQNQQQPHNIWNKQSQRSQNQKKRKRITDCYKILNCKKDRMRARTYSNSRNKKKVIKKRILSNRFIKNKHHRQRSNKSKFKLCQYSSHLNPHPQNTSGGNYSNNNIYNCQFSVQSNNGQLNRNSTYENNNFELSNPGYGFVAKNCSGQSYLNSGDNINVWPSSNYPLGFSKVNHNIENQMMNGNNVSPQQQLHNQFSHTINYGFQNSMNNLGFQSNFSFNNTINPGQQSNNSFNQIQAQTQNNLGNQMNEVNQWNNNTQCYIASPSSCIANTSNTSGYISNPSVYISTTPQNINIEMAIVCGPNISSHRGDISSSQNQMMIQKYQENGNNEMEQEENNSDNIQRKQSSIDQLNNHSIDSIDENSENPLNEGQLILTPKFPNGQNQSSYKRLNLLDQPSLPKPSYQIIDEKNSGSNLKFNQAHLSLVPTKASSNSLASEQIHSNEEQRNHRYILKKQEKIHQCLNQEQSISSYRQSEHLQIEEINPNDSIQMENDQLSSNAARSPQSQHYNQWLNIKQIVETLTEYQKPDLADFIVDPPSSTLNNLTMQQIKNLNGVTIENQFGKIIFLDHISLYKKKLGECIKISQDWVQILDEEWEGKHCEILFKNFANYKHNNKREKFMIRSTMKDWVRSNRMIVKEFNQTTGDLTVRLLIRFNGDL